MSSRRYYRIKEQTREEKAKKRQKFFFWFLFFLTFSIAAWSIFFSPFFRITEIRIPENGQVTNGNIKSFLKSNKPFDLGENILVLSGDRLKADIASAFPDITDIVVEKDFFNSITIDFKKRIQVGLWCNDNCYYFDKEGIIFKEAPLSEGSLILKVKAYDKNDATIGARVLNPEEFDFITKFSEEINKSDKLRISEFRIKPSSRLDLEALTDGNWSIYLDKNQNPILEAKNLFIILDESVKNKVSDLEYIDLRFFSYKLKTK